ncbi:disease resistance protein Pik-2-like isoform X2 [Phragmites australis]|nr:disease resistance protein Pik-2-like isoform X2 [Phragmites australis]
MEDDPRLRVLAIVGFGGLGKTTLARMVCESPTVKGADFHLFPLFIVSQTFNIRTLFQHMIRELIQRPHEAMAIAGGKHGHFLDENLEKIERLEVAELAKKLRRYLHDKRYIMILDDIWTISAWDSIRCVLPDKKMGSRVIITTRNEDVAKRCCSHPQDWIYKIQQLSDSTSRELFFKRIFGSADKLPNDELEEVSNSILKKCGGLPLAITSIGSLLASKTNRTKQEWQKVCDNLGSELESNPTLEGAKQVLTLSYDDLPYHLRACFLYLSIFPESYVIKRGPLVRRWIAEGFVCQRHGLSMEEVAESYFDEFVARSIVQPVRIDWNGKVRSCRVHEIMLEVIVSKSLEENFASFLCDNGSTLVSHDKIRRLSIHSSHNLVQNISASVSHVRSFTMSSSVEEVPCFFPQLRLLRVLDMQGCSCLSSKTLKCICNFFQLKYLSLRKTNVCKLPRRLGNLKHLETLDIRATLIKKLPDSAKNLCCIKHLLVGHKVHLTRMASVKYLNPCSGLEMGPGVIKNMAALQSLVHIVVKEQSLVLWEIGLLQKLRKLNVLFHNVEVNWKAFVESLGKLASSLRSLSIHILDEKEHSSSLDILDSVESPPLLITSFSLTGKLESLPPWISSLRSVSRITLRNTGLHAEAIKVLGDLPNLLLLNLYHKSYADGGIIFPHGKFAKLSMFVMDDPENIDRVHFEVGSVPNLERLTLSFLREPKDGISGIENLQKLKEIEFFGNIILSVVNKVASCVKTHPNHPRVICDKMEYCN